MSLANFDNGRTIKTAYKKATTSRGNIAGFKKTGIFMVRMMLLLPGKFLPVELSCYYIMKMFFRIMILVQVLIIKPTANVTEMTVFRMFQPSAGASIKKQHTNYMLVMTEMKN